MKIPKKQKLRRLLKVLSPDQTLPDLSDFDAHVSQLKENLKNKITVKTLEELNGKLEQFRKRIDLQPLHDSLASIENSFQEQIQSLYDDLETKTNELTDADEERAKELKNQIIDLKDQILEQEVSLNDDIKKVRKSIPDLTDLEDRVSELTLELDARITTLENEEPQEIKDWTDTIEKLRLEFLGRINSIGGGSMNRQIFIGGVDPLKKYTDINLKAGAGTTISYVDNNTTNKVDVTITGSAGSGIVRSINSISTSQTAAAAIATDYVYVCSAGIALTLPTAVSNTNLYTIKNTSTSSVLVATTGGQTIDGSTTAILSTQYTSIDVTSDGSNWDLT